MANPTGINQYTKGGGYGTSRLVKRPRKMESLLRLATKKEVSSPTAKRAAFQSLTSPKGMSTVFKPYGAQGRGFYASPNKTVYRRAK